MNHSAGDGSFYLFFISVFRIGKGAMFCFFGVTSYFIMLNATILFISRAVFFYFIIV